MTSPESPLVSILINNYNYGRFLRDAIDSALNQTYPSVEVIVVDDGSIDNSREIICTYGCRIIPVLKANGGQASAFNAGFAASKGEWIHFLDSDDFFQADKLQRLADMASTYPSAGMIAHNLAYCKADGSPISFVQPPILQRMVTDDRHRICRGKITATEFVPATSGISVRRDVLAGVLPMPEEIRLTADGYLRVVALSLAPVLLLPDAWAVQRIHGANLYTLANEDRVNKTAVFHCAAVNAVIAYHLRQKHPRLAPLAWKKYGYVLYQLRLCRTAEFRKQEAEVRARYSLVESTPKSIFYVFGVYLKLFAREHLRKLKGLGIRFLAACFALPPRTWRMLCARLHKLLFSEQWAIGIVKSPIQTFLDKSFSPDVRWVNNSSRFDYFADGFGIVQGDSRFIIAERFSYRGSSRYCLTDSQSLRLGRGHIASLSVDREGEVISVDTAIDLGSHMSYPFTLYDRGSWYAVAEEKSANRVNLYRRESQGGWCLAKELLPHAVIDPTVFSHNGVWWMFGTSSANPLDELCIWSADQLDGEWRPHPGNPLRKDRRNCRSGGTPFVVGNDLYRPTQNCTTSYGGSIIINKIDELTRTSFREHPVRELQPLGEWPYPDGLHTLSSFGEWTLIDAKREVILPRVIARKVARCLIGTVGSFLSRSRLCATRWLRRVRSVMIAAGS